MFPETAFGVFSALSGSLLTTNDTPNLLEVVRRVPHVLLWTWLNTFVFALANQRHPDSVEEDLLNKPWRPLPANRITQTQTRRLLLASLPIVLAICYFYLGGAEETVLLYSVTWMYNDLGGSDEDFVTRNFIIALAYTVYGFGSSRVACGYGQFSVNSTASCWLAMVGGVIFTTMQVQDLKDQEGDRVRNRKTAPLVLGDSTARLTVAVSVLTWSILCPAFWYLEAFSLGFFLPLGLGIVVATRVHWWRNAEADCMTWKLWSYWLASLYVLPLFKDYTVFVRFAEQWVMWSSGLAHANKFIWLLVIKRVDYLLLFGFAERTNSYIIHFCTCKLIITTHIHTNTVLNQ